MNEDAIELLMLGMLLSGSEHAQEQAKAVGLNGGMMEEKRTMALRELLDGKPGRGVADFLHSVGVMRFKGDGIVESVMNAAQGIERKRFEWKRPWIESMAKNLRLYGYEVNDGKNDRPASPQAGPTPTNWQKGRAAPTKR